MIVIQGLIALLAMAASVLLAYGAWPVITGRDEIQRWSVIYVSNFNIQFFMAVLGAYWVSAAYVTPWLLARLPLGQSGFIMRLLNIALNIPLPIVIAMVMGKSSPLGLL